MSWNKWFQQRPRNSQPKNHNRLEVSFQSLDLEDRETQEATMSVCMCLSVSQKIIRFKSMNSSVNSFLEWQKLLDIDESD